MRSVAAASAAMHMPSCPGPSAQLRIRIHWRISWPWPPNRSKRHWYSALGSAAGQCAADICSRLVTESQERDYRHSGWNVPSRPGGVRSGRPLSLENDGRMRRPRTRPHAPRMAIDDLESQADAAVVAGLRLQALAQAVVRAAPREAAPARDARVATECAQV